MHNKCKLPNCFAILWAMRNPFLGFTLPMLLSPDQNASRPLVLHRIFCIALGRGALDMAVFFVLPFFGKKYAQIVKTDRASKAEAIASHPVVPLRVVARRVIEPAREMCGKMAWCRLFLFYSFVALLLKWREVVRDTATKNRKVR